MTMHQTRRIPIVELNDYLTCKLCKGYFIDATTIIECLHTFCRSCIVKCLEENKYCPVCDVQVHKTKPLLNIRPDKTLQDIVYKLVPGLFQDEMCRRREFYATHQEAKPTNLEQCGEASYQHILSPAETICLSLNYHGSTTSPRYLRCSAAVSVMHLQKLLRSKYDLSDHHRVDVLYNEDCLNSRLALMDIAYMYLWKRKGPLELTYRIYENVTRKLKNEISNNAVSDNLTDNASQNDTKNEWKEVQLRISENGEMCFTGIDDTEILNNEIANCTKNNHKKEESDKCETDKKLEVKENLSANDKSNVESPNLKHKNLPKLALINTIKSPVSVNTTACTSSTTTITTNTMVTSNVEVQSNGKHKLKENLEDEPCLKQAKPTILNNLSLHNLSNNHPLKRHSQVRKSVEGDLKVPTSIVTTIAPPKPISKPVVTAQSRMNVPIVSNSGMQKWPLNKTPNLPCYVPKTNYNPIINVPKASTSRNEQRISVPQAPTQLTPTTSLPIVNSKVVKSKPNNPIGYKTLRDPPKTWNPQISRASLLKSPDTKFGGDLKNIKPAKFFKMRNNIPRYLGNPASGVKPLYQVHNVVEKEKAAEATNKPDKLEIKKHSIVKIDPKTLKPITEKAPEMSNLTNQVDLKINTSSVPIFNHLKLQSSPKNERKSPKSPQSPKLKTSPPPNKREKLNLNYTPPNPFIPNLGNPTLSPNQFLYPAGIPNLHSYDPRIVAAYHSYLYGQPLQFPPNHLNLNLDLNQRKNFETSSAPASPKFKCETKNEPPSSPKSSISPKVAAKNNLALKRTVKENSKHEKSLQNALEKLTQNRVKELTKLEENSDAAAAANHQVGEGVKNGKITESDNNVKSNGRKINNQQIKLSFEESSSNKCGGEKKQLVTKTNSEADEKSSDNNTNVSNNNNNTDSVSLVVVDANKK